MMWHLKCQNMFFTTCPIRLQWEIQLENGIGDFLNDYNQIRLVVKDMFWHCEGNKIFDFSST
jgi:hypothetical protein